MAFTSSTRQNFPADLPVKAFLSSALALILATLAHADLTVTQMLVQDAGPSKEVTMKVKGDKLRMDLDPRMSTIVNIKSGDMQTLMHERKIVMTIPGALAKTLQQSQPQAAGAEGLKATGNKETINGFACEEYVLTAKGSTVHAWVTKDLPAAGKLMKEMSAFSTESDPLKGALLNQNISGFPMRTIIEMLSGGKITVTVVAVNENPLADADFFAPKDYKVMPMPAIPGR